MVNHPGCTTADAIANVIKYKVPRTLEGTPQWYRAQLSELLSMVKKWGMPALFMTLTAGDKPPRNGGSRWTEVSIFRITTPTP